MVESLLLAEDEYEEVECSCRFLSRDCSLSFVAIEEQRQDTWDIMNCLVFIVANARNKHTVPLIPIREKSKEFIYIRCPSRLSHNVYHQILGLKESYTPKHSKQNERDPKP